MADRGADHTSPTKQGLPAKTRFDQLKQQVRDIKNDHREINQAKASEREARATAVSELVQGYEERLEEERASGAALAQRLKEALDRSAKMRSHAERDRRAMQVQIEKLQAAADAAARAADARLAEADAQKAREAAEWEARVEAERRAREDALRDLEASRLAFVAQVEEWSQGEVEAIQAVADERIAAARADALDAERRAEELQQQLAAAQECARQLREQLGAEAAGRRAAEGAARKLQGELDVARDAHARDARRWDEREQRWAAAEDAARREHDAAVRAVKAQHAAELDQVHRRLQAVLQRKDARLAALSAQLRAAEARQGQTEEVLERQRGALLAGVTNSVDLGRAGPGLGTGSARPGTAG